MTLKQTRKAIGDLIQKFCPKICALIDVKDLISKKVVRKYYDKIWDESRNNPNTTMKEWIHIYDCLLCANRGHQESIAYLKYLDEFLFHSLHVN